MYVVLLKLTANKAKAGEFMHGHNQWLKQGFDEGVFLMAGSLQPGLGGSIIAHNVSREALQERVNNDPFVIEQVVSVEILEIEPTMTDSRLDFLK